MAIIARLATRFNTRYEERPILTMMVTNALLGGIADTVAQTITSIRLRHQSSRKKADAKDDTYNIEIRESNRQIISIDRELIPEAKSLSPPFDLERLTRFMAYGFGMAPIQFKWFKFLERCFPLTSINAMIPSLKRVIFDQLVFAPVGIAWFFTAMTVAEGGGLRSVQLKLRDMFVPTLKANFIIWPAVQIINFRLMPVQFQLPFVSTIGIAWTAYLSLTNSSEDAHINKA